MLDEWTDGAVVDLELVELWEPGKPHEIYVRADSILSAIAELDENYREEFDTDDSIDALVCNMVASAKTAVIGEGLYEPSDDWDMEVISSNTQAG